MSRNDAYVFLPPELAAAPDEPIMRHGTPRKINSLARTSMTSIDFSLRRTQIAKLSCVNSSTTLSIRYFLPSCVRSSTKP